MVISASKQIILYKISNVFNKLISYENDDYFKFLLSGLTQDVFVTTRHGISVGDTNRRL